MRLARLPVEGTHVLIGRSKYLVPGLLNRMRVESPPKL